MDIVFLEVGYFILSSVKKEKMKMFLAFCRLKNGNCKRNIQFLKEIKNKCNFCKNTVINDSPVTKNYSTDGEHVQCKACLLIYFCL